MVLGMNLLSRIFEYERERRLKKSAQLETSQFVFYGKHH
jgi:hypothetical protein